MVSWTGSVPHIKLNGTHFQAQTIQLSTTEFSAEHKRHFSSTGRTIGCTYGTLFLSQTQADSYTFLGLFHMCCLCTGPPGRLIASHWGKIDHKTHMQRSYNRADEKSIILAKSFLVKKKKSCFLYQVCPCVGGSKTGWAVL